MYTHNLDPVLFNIGFIIIRWYSLAYIFGILFGWWLGKKIILAKLKNLVSEGINCTPDCTEHQARAAAVSLNPWRGLGADWWHPRGVLP